MQSKANAGTRSLAPLPVRAHPLVFGVVLFLASELMFFASLFAAFYDLRANHRVWPPASVHLDVIPASIGTVLLFLASAVMVLATKAMDRERFAAARWYTLGAIVAALGFSAIAIHSYADYMSDGFYISTSAYASIYWAMTGFHLLHVIVGIGVLTALLAGMRSPALLSNCRAGAEAMTYYWHFVFIVWLGIWSSIFLVG
jgi:cytochrome c oxidase subunit III